MSVKMTRSLKSKQRKAKLMAVVLTGTGTAALSGLDQHQMTLTDNGVGDYTLTFDDPMVADFSAIVSSQTVGIIPQVFAKTATSLRIKTFLESSSSGSATAAVKASGLLNMPTDDITITADAFGDEANGIKVTINVEAAAANAADKCLVDIEGDERNISIKITPDNTAVAPNILTVTELVSIINTGSNGANSTVTDAKNLLSLISATGSGTTDVFADAGVGDGVTVTLAGGSDASSTAAGVARAAADAVLDIIIVGSEASERF